MYIVPYIGHYIHIIYEVYTYAHTQGGMDQRAVAMLAHVNNDHVVQSEEDLTPKQQNVTPPGNGSRDDNNDMIGAMNKTSLEGPVEIPDEDLDRVDGVNVNINMNYEGSDDVDLADDEFIVNDDGDMTMICEDAFKEK